MYRRGGSGRVGVTGGRAAVLSFSRTWRRFKYSSGLLIPTAGVREAWHQGRRWYHVTVLVVDDERVRARREQVVEACAAWADPFCVDVPHVTVFVHGFSRPAPVDEGCVVPILVGGANAFSSCTFLEVRCAELRPLRASVAGPEERWSAYRPHLTCGRFARPGAPGEVAEALRPVRGLAPLRVDAVLRAARVDAFSEDGALFLGRDEG